MPDFFEADEIVKSYDSAIVGRIFTYVKPYRALLAAATISLALSTVGELVLPVLVKKTVDEALVVSWVAIDAAAKDDGRLRGVDFSGKAPEAGGRIYITEAKAASIALRDKESLEADGSLDPGPYYLTPVSDYRDLPAAITAVVGSDGGPVMADGWFIAPSAYVQIRRASCRERV